MVYRREICEARSLRGGWCALPRGKKCGNGVCEMGRRELRGGENVLRKLIL